ncbi:hypothetical protein ACPCYY_17925 [Bacillus pumilus]|nr:MULTISPECIES: hypothetical protein [Bacillus]AZV55112.1 hypothetical protein DKE43_16175 [Bacillus pumilus]MBR0621890.1 hypothetical protein [Bacillus pumilus]PRS49871.1 hypothetical protein C6Y06_13510 [Bacillus sp. MZGC1]
MKKIFTFFLILLMISLISACQSNKFNNTIKDKAPDPSVSIKDLDNSTKDEPKLFYFDTEQKQSLFKVIFWENLKEDLYYQGQIKNNDVAIENVFKGEDLEVGPLPKNYELAMTFSQKEPTPTKILGKLKDDRGITHQWEQSYDIPDADHDFLINLPRFKGQKAEIALRMIWLNKDNNCIGVADKYFVVSKQ